MPRGLPGVDSSIWVTHEVKGRNLVDLARGVFGTCPAFWGRYFHGPDSTGSVYYDPARENEPLRAGDIRVLPIARQSKRVNGEFEFGVADARANVQAIFSSFDPQYLASLSDEFLVFLGVGMARDLAAEYYLGWSNELQRESLLSSKSRVRLVPCVYANCRAIATWRNLSTAVSKGSQCGGVWVAGYTSLGFPEWNSGMEKLGVPNDFKVLCWQYWGDYPDGDGIDLNQTNPTIRPHQDFINKLILPPK